MLRRLLERRPRTDAYARVYAAAYASWCTQIGDHAARKYAEDAVHHFAGVMEDLRNG